MSILFHVYRQSSADGSRDTPIKLHLWTRNELITIGMLLPLATTYLRAPPDDRIYGADASLVAAGGVVAKVGPRVIKELWRRISVKVRHLGLLDPVTAELRVAGFDADAEEEDEELPFVPEGEITTGETCAVIRSAIDDDFDKRALIAAGQPSAGLGTCCFAVLEVCGGCGGITKWCNRMGLVTGPVIELKQGADIRKILRRINQKAFLAALQKE